MLNCFRLPLCSLNSDKLWFYETNQDSVSGLNKLAWWLCNFCCQFTLILGTFHTTTFRKYLQRIFRRSLNLKFCKCFTLWNLRLRNIFFMYLLWSRQVHHKTMWDILKTNRVRDRAIWHDPMPFKVKIIGNPLGEVSEKLEAFNAGNARRNTPWSEDSNYLV